MKIAAGQRGLQLFVLLSRLSCLAVPGSCCSSSVAVMFIFG